MSELKQNLLIGNGGSGNVRARMQKFGGVLSGMVMPNIGAFITWGLITAIFLKTGWYPNETIAKLIGPMLTYLLPLLIGYTGGENVYGKRGGVIGAAATMGVIVGAEIPMFMGAMIMGPLAAFCMKKVDQQLEGHIKPGLEMLVNNFSMGFLGILLVLIAYFAIGPFVSVITGILSAGVNWIIANNLIPFSSLFIEPAKVLFLNNAINHGILSPIGITQAASAGKSILFLLEPNPGPGLGVLLAYSIFGRGTAKSTAPGVAIIHCIGGIHEPYFPYILMKPQMIIAPMIGAVCGNFIFTSFNVGLVATASPGSFFSILAVAPRQDWLPILAGILLATAVSFAIGSFILKVSYKREDAKGIKNDDLSKAIAAKDAMKLEGTELTNNGTVIIGVNDAVVFTNKNIKKIYVACDAGMGSSVMGASILKKKIKEAGLNVEVEHSPITQVPENAEVIVTHESLTQRAASVRPTAMHISIDNFLASPKYDEIVNALK